MDKHSPFCLIKPLRKSCRIDRYEHGERSMLVFISTVTSMENDRYQGRRITFLFDNQRYYQKKVLPLHLKKT